MEKERSSSFSSHTGTARPRSREIHRNIQAVERMREEAGFQILISSHVSSIVTKKRLRQSGEREREKRDEQKIRRLMRQRSAFTFMKFVFSFASFALSFLPAASCLPRQIEHQCDRFSSRQHSKHHEDDGER